MHKGFIKTAAIFGAISVALGAFAAHSLKQNIEAEIQKAKLVVVYLDKIEGLI